MDIRQVVPGFAVSPQILPQEVAAAAELGYRTLICNRPDGEAADQPAIDAIKAAAKAAGVDFIALPVHPGNFTHELIDGMAVTLAEAPAPILAYCRSGTRSCMLWALASACDRPTAEIVAAGDAAGYDLRSLVPALSARATAKGA